MAEINYKDLYFNCIKTTKEMLEKQLENIKKTNEDSYAVGLYNGIEICRAMLTLTEPKFYEKEENKNGEI